MAEVKALVLTGYGLNCDYETAHTLALAGASAERVHINSLIAGDRRLADYRILAFGGGFSWADDHGAGVIQAVRLKTNIGDQLLRFIDQGNLVIGICNGFQALVNLGLLPGFDGDYRTRSVAMTYNDCGNFRDDWVCLAVDSASPCVFTRGIERIELPIRHGEGKFYAEPAVIAKLVDRSQVVMRYADSDGNPAEGRFPQNPNGSIHDIAGICDSTGRIFGLMPHPEAYHHPTNHPRWTRRKSVEKRSQEPRLDSGSTGVELFRNAVDYLR